MLCVQIRDARGDPTGEDTMAAEIFTEKWAKEWGKKINSNAAYKKAAANWEGAVALVMTADSGYGVATERAVVAERELGSVLRLAGEVTARPRARSRGDLRDAEGEDLAPEGGRFARGEDHARWPCNRFLYSCHICLTKAE